MRFTGIVFLFLIFCPWLRGQQSAVRGQLTDRHSGRPLPGLEVTIEGSDLRTNSDGEGRFKILAALKGEYVLRIEGRDYQLLRIPLLLGTGELNLGVLFIDRDIKQEQTAHLVALTTEELNEEDTGSAELLQSTRDIFLSRAAFDFGQAFFRVRGYDSAYGKVLLNGIPVNKFIDGRPQWNNWGGLNYVTGNQELVYGLQASEKNFGGVLGTTHIDLHPSSLRPGIRVSGAASNRAYAGRFMGTYNSGKGEHHWAYTISASRRWAGEGYIRGTVYDAYSVYGGLEYLCNDHHSFRVTGILAATRRGLSPAITEEVFQLRGNRYNSYWGIQDGEPRNSRERKIQEPLLILDHRVTSGRFGLNTGIAFQFGNRSRSRLGYYNAPNPDPSYYRYLPSYYVNSPLGANFQSAQQAREGFLENPQLNWKKLYAANKAGGSSGAAYILYDDAVSDREVSVNSVANIRLYEALTMDMGFLCKSLRSDNFARITDLLGARYYEDRDPFTATLNDVSGPSEKGEDALINYNYRLLASRYEVFSQLRFNRDKWKAFLSGKYDAASFQREGLFLNERFPEASLGKSVKVPFTGMALKAGCNYMLTGRHSVAIQAALIRKPPQLQNVFINPREYNAPVPGIRNERITAIDLTYHLRLPHITGRFSGYYTRFQHTTDVNFFFVDAGVGSYFVQEVISGLDKLHKGLEMGLEYEASPTVKLSAAMAVGKHTFASDPDVTINFVPDPEEQENNPAATGNISLGQAGIKGYKVAQGPQQAYSVGVAYRDPGYWWTSITANYLTNNYINISAINRTRSFYLNPDTGEPFPDATPRNVNRLLEQEPLDEMYYLNLTGGKSWLKNGVYVSVFASVNNLFNAIFRTGGYEQSRNGNYGQMARDYLSGDPVFGPKYWYGYGRTFFLNLAVSF